MSRSRVWKRSEENETVSLFDSQPEGDMPAVCAVYPSMMHAGIAIFMLVS